MTLQNIYFHKILDHLKNTIENIIPFSYSKNFTSKTKNKP